MAQHFSRDITPLTYTFTENTDISLESNRHMMLHELRKLMQEMRNIKLDVHNYEEKFKRLKTENDDHLQKLLEEIKEMKLYINVLETEKQRTNTENNEMRTQVTALREKQEKEINELRTTISGLETKISELETKCCQVNTENTIVKENVPTPIIINGLYEQMVEDDKSRDWSRSVELMKRHFHNSSPAYEQLNNISEYLNYPLRAARRGYIELIQVMLDNGLSVNTGLDYYNNTMLHEAALIGQYKLVKFLIKRGADVNVRDVEGRTPIHWAACNGQKSVVQHLVKKGCDTTITNRDGDTALHLAASNGHRLVVKYLVDKGCDTTITNKYGKTAANRAKTQEIRQILL